MNLIVGGSGAHLSKGEKQQILYDFFCDFLREKLAENCRVEEIHALEKKVADALFDEEDYYAAAAHYIRCSDFRGLSDCCAAFRRIAASSSIEDRIAFFKLSFSQAIPVCAGDALNDWSLRGGQRP